MVNSPPVLDKQRRPPVPLNPETLLSPHQMASRLRTRLRRARSEIERDLGHSLTAIVPQPASPRSRRRQPLALGMRAHSYSHGDFPSEPGPGAPPLQRRRSAAPSAPALDLPSSPPVLPATPQLQPQDSENEIARTILMLATPPAARAPSLSESPCQRSARTGNSATQPRRRLSFSRHRGSERSGRRGSPYARPSETPPPPTTFDTPNLSQIAALAQPVVQGKRSASGGTIPTRTQPR
ncbi:hypothetical protein H4R23_001173 [Coemansia sp. Cherry 401B]|nr:hypothetical protein IWW54_001467 [Coemansia sp. RSA 2705]KAJ2738397.1 hypothetical protein H4R23_001173 [Coemansia sp. Cherry 401B]